MTTTRQAVTADQLLHELADLLGERKKPDKPLIVGITGMDTSGKSQLATALAAELGRRGQPRQLVRIDDFHHPRSHRYRSDLPEPEQYYQHSIDFTRCADEVLRPIRTDGRLDKQFTLLDVAEDTYTLHRGYSVSAETIVLVEGVFLFRPEIRELIEMFVSLVVREDVVLDRARIRDVPAQGEDVLRKYHTKYLPAQRSYLAQYPSARYAEVVVDNSDWTTPVVERWPAHPRSTADGQ